jgi:hypothetical protein
MALATSSASVPGESISAPEDGAVGQRRHALFHAAHCDRSHDHAYTRTNYTSCIS